MRDAEAEAYLDRFEQSGGPLLSALRSALEPAALVRVLGGPGCALWGGAGRRAPVPITEERHPERHHFNPPAHGGAGEAA